MNVKKAAATVVLAASSLMSMSVSAQDTPTVEELWKIVQAQQAEIQALRNEVREARQQAAEASSQVEMTDAKVEATGDFIESLASTDMGAKSTSIGGYGELHYNRVDTDAGTSEEIDFHRFVLFFGHQFTDRIHFFSEFELEHSLAGDGAPGEVELEQAYVDYAINDSLNARTGLFLSASSTRRMSRPRFTASNATTSRASSSRPPGGKPAPACPGAMQAASAGTWPCIPASPCPPRAAARFAFAAVARKSPRRWRAISLTRCV